MLRKLVATGILLFIGYVIGVFFGYRSAVIDYVENDAETIESMADDIYPSPSEGDQRTVPDEVGALIEEVEREDEEDDDAGTKAFH